MIQISKNINQAIKLLNNNEIVAIPTETVYGLAGNIYNENAIKKIFEVKKRPFFNPLIVHCHSIEEVKKITTYFPAKAQLLADYFWPGPLTLVLQKKDFISDFISAGKSTIAVRIPKHPVTMALLRSIDFPLAAPSANPFGSISPTSANHVASYFKNDLEMVLDGGKCDNGLESTIIGFDDNDEPILYRLGSVSIEDIEMVIGTIKTNTKSSDPLLPEAPGMLTRHYAPNKPTFLTHDLNVKIHENRGRKIGVLSFMNTIQNSSISHLEVLSPSGNLAEAGANLYEAMHNLDHADIDIILAEIFPNYGIGKSINDRLERATQLK